MSKKLPIMLLTISSGLAACQTMPPKPAPYQAPQIVTANSQILEVLPLRTSCDSSSPMQCLMVKPAGSADSDIFGIGFNAIKGFEPKLGVRYKIRVSQEFEKSTNTPTGTWQLEEILSQTIN